MTMYSLSKQDLSVFLNALKEEYRVLVPEKKNEKLYFSFFSGNQRNIEFGEVRTVEPVKSFFFKGREKVMTGLNREVPVQKDKPLCIAGVKACDLKGFQIQDFVFTNHDYADPFYIQNRENNIIIASDCTCSIETCFCLALGVKPYAETDFDLNISALKDGFVVETGSEKGEKLVSENRKLFRDCPKAMKDERDKKRKEVIRSVEKNIKQNQVPDQKKYKKMIERNYESDIWMNESRTCVECGACNTICPTCHCFLLYDQKDKKSEERLRVWDSCLIKDFAVVAGGANPREKLWMRLRNRFEKKFDYFPQVADIHACTGCGRCILACPAKIDIRKVLKELVAHA